MRRIRMQIKYQAICTFHSFVNQTLYTVGIIARKIDYRLYLWELRDMIGVIFHVLRLRNSLYK